LNDSLAIAIRAVEEMMAARAPSVKRYVVRLSAEKRGGLEAIAFALGMGVRGAGPIQPRALKARIHDLVFPIPSR
jgi:hypothetical protein